MGIEAKALISRVLEPLNNGVELFSAESRLAYGATDDSSDIEELQMMTLLLSFAPADAARWSARVIAATLVAAYCKFEQISNSPDLAQAVIEWLGQRAPSSLCLVVALPDYSAEVSRQIANLLEAIRQTRHHQLNLAIAIAVDPKSWSGCQGFDGYVVSDAEDAHGSALIVFNMLTAFMAPGMAVCVDSEDLRTVLGSQKRPSTVTSGVWLPESGAFLIASTRDGCPLRSCQAVAFMALNVISLSATKKILNLLRESINPEAEVVIISPYGLSAEPLMKSQLVPVSLIYS